MREVLEVIGATLIGCAIGILLAAVFVGLPVLVVFLAGSSCGPQL